MFTAVLPMPVSIHYAKHVLMAVLIAGPRLEMKRTARKQIRIFLTKIAAIDVVALWASKDGKGRCTFLTNIFKYHSDMERFKTEHQEIKAATAAPPLPQRSRWWACLLCPSVWLQDCGWTRTWSG